MKPFAPVAMAMAEPRSFYFGKICCRYSVFLNVSSSGSYLLTDISYSFSDMYIVQNISMNKLNFKAFKSDRLQGVLGVWGFGVLSLIWFDSGQD